MDCRVHGVAKTRTRLSDFHIKGTWGLPWWLSSEESACSAGDTDSIPGSGRSPGGGHGNPLPYPCLEKPHGQRSLVGYSPRGHKVSDMT